MTALALTTSLMAHGVLLSDRFGVAAFTAVRFGFPCPTRKRFAYLKHERNRFARLFFIFPKLFSGLLVTSLAMSHRAGGRGKCNLLCGFVFELLFVELLVEVLIKDGKQASA